jgi:arylsulfatase A-like enzyme/cytochrome c-type biogenesis protein CcmH/NrfG
VLLAGTGLAAVIALAALRSPGVRREPGLSVLLITIDTLRADAVGAYGHSDAGTPWMDRLAAEGVRFERAHAHNVMTFPSHANMLAGRYPLRHGVRDNAGFRFPTGMETLATLLRARGYHTGAFVSAFPLDSRFGLNRGFDVYDDRFGESAGPGLRLDPWRPGAETVAAAQRWLSAQASGSYFCWVHLYEPHWPYTPPEPFASRFQENPYQGEVAAADAALGPILQPILEQGRSTRTLVVLTSDHGEALGDHGEDTHGILAYEATLRVPLVLYAPRLLSPRVVPDPVRHVDLLPTILDALGLAAPAWADGKSLLALASGRHVPPETSYFEALTGTATRGWAPLYGFVQGSQKFIDLPIPELYDLDSDPRESENLVASRPEDVSRMRSLLVALRDSDPGLQRVAESEQTREQLKALGYVSNAAPIKARYTEDDDPKRLMHLSLAISDVINRYNTGDPRGALARCREIVAARPTMALGFHYLAFLEWQLGEKGAAIEASRKALALNPENTEVASRLGVFLAQSGRAAEGVVLLEPFAGRPEPDADVLMALALAYAELGRTTETIATFDRLLDFNPTNAMALLSKGRACLQAGRKAEAREALAAALRRDPALGLAHVSLGFIESQDGHVENALAEWRKALDVDPSAYEALFNLGVTLVQQGRTAEARPYIERYLREAPPAEAASAAQLRALLAKAAGRGAPGGP